MKISSIGIVVVIVGLIAIIGLMQTRDDDYIKQSAIDDLVKKCYEHGYSNDHEHDCRIIYKYLANKQEKPNDTRVTIGANYSNSRRGCERVGRLTGHHA